jgi:hypothetical protein
MIAWLATAFVGGRFIPKWTRLREIGNSSATKMTILIPLVGYLIIFNQNVVGLLTLSRELVGMPAHQEPSTRLLCMYFGLCLIAVGSIVYNVLCPSIVKRYTSAPEFIGNELAHVSTLFTVENISLELLASPYKEDYARIRFDLNSSISKYMPEGIDDIATVQRRKDLLFEANKNTLTLYYDFLNLKYPWARATASVLFASGLTLLALPSL